jgi:hypothetical protein
MRLPRTAERQAAVRGPGAAAVHGGTETELLEEVAYIRAAASRAGVPVRQACQDLN